MFNKIVSLSFIFICIISCSHQPPLKTKYIRLKGSDTMKIMALRWAEEYMKEHPDISVYVDGGGSAQGFQALIEDESDICASSRPMLPHEVRQLAEKHQRLGISHLVAKDALSVYLNLSNPIRNLSIKQLKDIYTGRVTNWNEVGGLNQPIILYSRSPNSGTYLYFKEHVLGNEAYAAEAEIRFSTQSVVDGVIENTSAIGYGGTAYGEKVYHCKIDSYAPGIENVLHDYYPIARYLYLYTLDTPKGHIKDFIDWILDRPGQVIVAKVGYIPLFQTDAHGP
jgi:phosphate transport system substrate-binding protein